MKNILIQSKNDRGGQVCVSTQKDSFPVEVFFVGTGGIRKTNIRLSVSDSGDMLFIMNADDDHEGMAFPSKPVEKLSLRG